MTDVSLLAAGGVERCMAFKLENKWENNAGNETRKRFRHIIRV